MDSYTRRVPSLKRSPSVRSHLTAAQDINNSGDGGIYAELIRNRAFQWSSYYTANLDGWHAINARLTLQNLSDHLSDALPTSMEVRPGKAKGAAGFYNDGYWGIDVKQQTYTGSF